MSVPGKIVDLSSANGNPATFNWHEAKAAGVIAVFCKATQGTTYKNPDYMVNGGPVRQAGIGFRAYHFAEFTDAAKEAAYFRSVAGADGVILDSETSTNEAWQNAFLAALNVPADEELDYGSASSLPRSGIRALLWPASYGKAPGFGDCWQSTDTGSVAGIPGDVDLSEWIGSQADFDVFFGLAPAPIPTPTAQEEPSMFAYDPTSGGFWATDANGDLYCENGAPFIQGLNQHPEYDAGSAESGGKNPCIGIVPFKDKNGQIGICYVTSTPSGGTPYSWYRFARDGSVD